MDGRGASSGAAGCARMRPRLREERGVLARSQYRGDPRVRSIVYVLALSPGKRGICAAVWTRRSRPRIVVWNVRTSPRYRPWPNSCACRRERRRRRYLARKAIGNLSWIRRTRSTRRRELLSRRPEPAWTSPFFTPSSTISARRDTS